MQLFNINMDEEKREEQMKGLCIMCHGAALTVWVNGRLWWDTATVYTKKNDSNEIQRCIKVFISQLTIKKNFILD